MWKQAGVYRDKHSLKKALKKLKEWDKTITDCDLDNIDQMETANILTLALLITNSALLREESRGSHQRSDFPKEDKSWQKKEILFNKINFNSLIPK